MCRTKIRNWWHSIFPILPTSAYFQTIIIFLTLLAGWITDILGRHFLDFTYGAVVSLWDIHWEQGRNNMGVKWWVLPLEFAMLAGVVAAITTFLMRANNNQRSRERTLQNEQMATNKALTASLDRLSTNIERLINNRRNTNETTTQDNQTQNH